MQAKYEYDANGEVHTVLGHQAQYLSNWSEASNTTGTSAGRYARVKAVAGGSWGTWKAVG